jgi:hypothetical protein
VNIEHSFCEWQRTGVRSWWTVADPADLAGFDFADRLASAKWVPPHGGFASTGHSPEGRTLQQEANNALHLFCAAGCRRRGADTTTCVERSASGDPATARPESEQVFRVVPPAVVAVVVVITGNARGTLRRTHRLAAIRRTVGEAGERLVAAVGGLSPQSMSATPRARSSSPTATRRHTPRAP